MKLLAVNLEFITLTLLSLKNIIYIAYVPLLRL